MTEVGNDWMVVTVPRTEHGLPDLRWDLHGAMLAGARTLLVDASGSPQLSSTEVAALLTVLPLCRARGGSVVLCGAGRPTRDLLRRTGLHHVFGTASSVEAWFRDREVTARGAGAARSARMPG